MRRSGEIGDKIDSLLTNISEAGLKFELAQNEFQNLKNTQFIESRVYDDDELLDSKDDKVSSNLGDETVYLKATFCNGISVTQVKLVYILLTRNCK